MLKNKIDLKTIKLLYMHDDADGISSAVLLSHVFPVTKVFCPEDFGVWEPKADLAKNYVPPNVCVDMIPQDSSWNGICFDHHPNHPPASERKYTLVWDQCPATKIIYDLYKDKIPKEHRWKIAVGLVGDGAANLIPSEIWRSYPELMHGYSTYVAEKYGKLTISIYPMYMRLSSFVNAACKIPDKWYIAYQVMKNARSPLDIVEDPALKACKDAVRDEMSRILRDSRPIDLPYIRFWRIDSVMKLERTIGWKSNEKDHKTTLVLNTKTNRMSIRGVMSLLLFEELNKMGYQVNGHPGFGGGRLVKGQTPQQLLKDIKKIKLI